ncbi:MAG TPA: aspartyl/asparaginyl beta-hydroxylase domain-containing protein [Steroidobacteraceae bacterium]|nr:aspartyl/asparaginyl beta-hydroxylase domain-containing protein [Steroidobacteraceae bacterium]
MSSPPNARAGQPTPAEQRVLALMAACDRALAERRDGDAARALKEAEAILPEHPLVLHERARRALGAGDPAAARALLERVVAIAPRHPPFWLSLADVLRVLALADEELAALEQVLCIEPAHPLALLRKAALFDRTGKRRSAALTYGNALATINPQLKLPPAIEALVVEARRRVAEGAAELDGVIGARIGALRAGHDARERRRFERCLDRLLGRAQIHSPEPTFLLFPYLRNFEFYERSDFPWLEALEAATEAIRDECLGALGEDADGVRPYVAYRDGLPLRQWQELNNSRRWGAYFLWDQSERVEDHIARCPRTAAALGVAPRVDIPGRGPTAFFSILDARTRIPAHHGVTNTRLTVHLPLVIPPGCGFRVGSETREWRVGEAWVFDDTIEHEAWNDSDVPRAILIFDVWHPELTALERDLVREMMVAVADYYGVEGMPSMEL